MPRAHPCWSRPSRSPGAPAWLSIAGSSATCSAHGGLVHPATLAAGVGPHFLDSLPEAERTVGDRELGCRRKSAPLQVEEQLFPRLCTLAHPVDKSDQLLLAFGRGADNDQQALRGVLEPGLDVDAVGPEVDIALGGEIALAPAGMLLRPG